MLENQLTPSQKTSVTAAWAFFSAHLEKPRRGAIFHYTSLAGLYGILTTKAVWVTDTGFLNDPSELRYGRDVITSVMERHLPTYKGDVRQEIQNAVERSYDTSDLHDTFVASFSEKPDMLRQWVAYTPSTAGVSVGFRPRWNPGGHRVLRVVYDRRRQERIVEELFGIWAKTFSDPATSQTVPILTGVFGLIVHYLTLAFKDKAFADEREWRLVTFHRRDQGEVKHRVVGATLVPYREISLQDDKGLLPITRVVMGPALDAERNARSIATLLRQAGTKASITRSRIPFRIAR